METVQEKRPFNTRAFISVGLFISGIWLPLSGIMNHTYAFGGMMPEKHFWMSVHNMSGLFFTVFAIIHIILNWRALKNYASKAKVLVLSREALTASLLVIAVVALFSSHAFLAR